MRTISILEKVRAPSRFLVRKGLEWGGDVRSGTSRQLPAEEVVPAPRDEDEADARHDGVHHLVVVVPAEAADDEVTDDETDTYKCEVHDFLPQGAVLGGNIPPRSWVFGFPMTPTT